MYHSKVNFTETKMLKENKIVFFFHLLGIDTNGHSKKPHSKYDFKIFLELNFSKN